MKAAIILANIQKLNQDELLDSYIIGADKGALRALELGITPNVAIGDFDSVTKEEFEQIQKNIPNLIQLNPIKDKSDTDEAIDLCDSYDEITIYGGIEGKRIEHFYAILLYLKKDARISIQDGNSRIETKSTSFIPNSRYKYISLFAIEPSVITLEGMKYNLDHYVMDTLDPLGLSNEIIQNPRVTIHSGRLLVISSGEDHEKL